MAPPRFSSTSADPAPLFQPLNYVSSGYIIPNRFLKAAMSERLASWDNKIVSARGIPSEELITLYKHWGAGGWGQILTGNIIIDGINLEGPGNMVIPADASYEGPRFDAFQKLSLAAKAHGSVLLGQVSHAGRQVEDWLQPHPVSASDIQLRNSSTGRIYNTPTSATKDDISDFIKGFGHAAVFLQKAGFDGIELHGAHGYLLSQFLSPRTNQRTDEYGGNIENRSRLVFEIADEIRRRAGKHFILGIKINAVEYHERGIDLEDVKKLCITLEKKNFDFIEVSGGNYEKLAFAHVKEQNRQRENFFLSYAEEIAKGLEGHTKLFSTGGFRTVAGMVNSLDTLDGVGIGRAACQEPRLPNDIRDHQVQGVINHGFYDDMGKRFMAASVQIKQIAHDLEPSDLTVQANVDSFWQDILKYMEEVHEDTEHKLSQFPTLTQPSTPYGR